MSDRGPLFQNTSSTTPDLETEHSSSVKEIAFSSVLTLIFGSSIYLITLSLRFLGVSDLQSLYEGLLLGIAVIFFAISTFTIGFGSSPSLSSLWARITGSRREITPSHKTFTNGVKYLFSGLILIFFASFDV